MVVHSAGIIPWRRGTDGIEVFLVHMGGPLWARKDAGAWSVAKGEFDPASETAEAAARREFHEETGIAVEAPLVALGEFRVTSRKLLHAFACEADAPWGFVGSNTFEMEWPPRSGRRQSFPEVDRAEWWGLVDARGKILAGQHPVLDALCSQPGVGLPLEG